MNSDLFKYNVIDGRGEGTSNLCEVFQLRYQVYVNEWGFERSEDHPNGVEMDEYDPHSIHIYACSEHSKEAIGAARIILGAEKDLPIERHFKINQFPSGLEREKIAEISRLAISKKFRCVVIERLFFETFKNAPKNMLLIKQNRRDFRKKCEHQLVRGLLMSLYRECKLRGLTHLFTVMAKGLHVILKRWGFCFEQIGPSRDYHGMRAPYLISIEDFERSLLRNNPPLLGDAQNTLLKYAS